jgi:hypothetical protein
LQVQKLILQMGLKIPGAMRQNRPRPRIVSFQLFV